MAQEHERRYVIRGYCLPHEAAHPLHIRQGYAHTPPFHTFRVRLVNDTDWCITRKYGVGEVREEEEVDVSPEIGGVIMKTLPYKLVKFRHRVGNCVVDRYRDILQGLSVAELELDDPDADRMLPEWIGEYVDVTDRLTNYTIAQATRLLEGIEPRPDLFELFTFVPKRIVVTGGPCSGKTSILKMLKTRHSDHYMVVPEVATILFSELGVQYPSTSQLGVRQFQQQVYAVQRSFEELAAIETAIFGKQSIILDRGSLDNAAYLDNGADELERICNTSTEHELARYAAVIFLAPPPRAVYEAYAADNPARRETYEQALEVAQRTRSCWHRHPHFIEVDGPTWPDKVQTFHNVLASLGV